MALKRLLLYLWSSPTSLLGLFFLFRGVITGYLGAGLLAVAIWLTYFFVSEAVSGQTIGKRMTKLRVVMRDGRPAPANAIAARTVLRLIDVVPYAWIFGGTEYSGSRPSLICRSWPATSSSRDSSRDNRSLGASRTVVRR